MALVLGGNARVARAPRAVVAAKKTRKTVGAARCRASSSSSSSSDDDAVVVASVGTTTTTSWIDRAKGVATATCAAAALLVSSPAAHAELNAREANRGGEFNRGSAQQFGGYDLRNEDVVGEYGADLRLSNFTGAEMRGAKLRGANLTGAYLMKAVAFEADFEGANLSDALMDRAVLNRRVLFSHQTGPRTTASAR